MSRQRIAILGPGAIGGVLAARLDKGGHEVTVIATERTAALITLAGLELRTPQETLATRPTARPWLTDAVDVLFVATKSTDLLTALTRTPPQPLTNGTIVPVLNGVDHLPLLRATYPQSRVVAATISVEATRRRPGLIEQESASCELTVAVDPAQPNGGATVASLLSDAGLDVATDPDELSVLWRKLAFLAPYALLTASTRSPVGAAREEHRDWVTALATESTAAAEHNGVVIDAASVSARLAGMPPPMRSSMLKDLEAGKPLELDAIAGPILRALGAEGAPSTATAVRQILAATGANR